MIARREIQVVSMSFLDVISNGFGAIILLLALTRVYEPVIIEDAIRDLSKVMARLEQQLVEIRGETRDLAREMLHKEDTLVSQRDRLARLQAELAAINKMYESTNDSTSVNSSGWRALRFFTRWMPSESFNEMSTMARSGFSEAASFIASSALSAWPQTSRSSSLLMIRPIPSLSTGWSSTSNTFVRARTARSFLESVISCSALSSRFPTSAERA